MISCTICTNDKSFNCIDKTPLWTTIVYFVLELHILYPPLYAPLQKYWYYYYVLWSDFRWLVEMNILVLISTTFWKCHHVLCFLKMYCVHCFLSLGTASSNFKLSLKFNMYLSCFVKKDFFFLIYRSSNLQWHMLS